MTFKKGTILAYINSSDNRLHLHTIIRKAKGLGYISYSHSYGREINIFPDINMDAYINVSNSKLVKLLC